MAARQYKYDVVIVGGHNGLASAMYLAKASLSILIVEYEGLKP